MNLATESKKKEPIYCVCSSATNAYSGLFGAGETKTGGYAWVHNPCGKPTETVFLAWAERCFSCLSPFSSPWEQHCVDCHSTLVAEGTIENRRYRGWRWGCRQPQPWMVHENSSISLEEST